MNNSFYDIPADWYNEFNNTFMDQNNNMPNIINKSNNLIDPKMGFERGNLFNNLYNPYKNYKYRELKPQNNQEELLYEILKYNFAITELDLYLDINPNDSNMINTYNKYLEEKKKLCNMYEQNYGPLTLDGFNLGTNNWNWDRSPWPWEVIK